MKLGIGDWFRNFTGIVEVLGVIAILVPRTSLWGTGLLLTATLGALVAQLTVLHVGWFHCAAIGAGLIVLIGMIANGRQPARG